jgi:hypothetical protein
VGFTGAGGEFFDGAFVNLQVVLAKAFLVDGFGDGSEEFQALKRPMVEGVAGGVEAESLEDGLLPVDGKVVGKFRDDELGGEAEGGHASGERAGGCRGDERGLAAVVFAAEFRTNEASLDEAGGFVVEKFGDFLANEFELVFVLLVALGEESFFDDFELFPAFEAAVVFTLGLLSLFVFGLCFVCPLRFFGLVSRGGVGLFRL